MQTTVSADTWVVDRRLRFLFQIAEQTICKRHLITVTLFSTEAVTEGRWVKSIFSAKIKLGNAKTYLKGNWMADRTSVYVCFTEVSHSWQRCKLTWSLFRKIPADWASERKVAVLLFWAFRSCQPLNMLHL